MSLFNEIWTGRHLQRLYKTFGIRAPESRITLAPEVQPTFDIEAHSAEYQYLGGERLTYGARNLGASVGNITTIGVFNPVASQSLVIVENVAVGTILAAAVRMGVAVADPALTLIGSQHRDTRAWRSAFASNPLAQLEAGNPAASIILFPQDLGTINGFQFFTEDWILSPGFGLFVETQGTNVQLYGGFWWREREADSLELKPF